MTKSLAGFRTALAAGWIALVAVGFGFARAKNIPMLAALPVIAAFLFEYPFYLAAGFPAVREKLGGPKLPAILVASAVLPYLVCTLGVSDFHWVALVRLAALALALSLWYRVLPASRLTDAAFLLMIAFVLIGRYFDGIYPVFFRQKLWILGLLALSHMSVLVLTLERRIRETGFGFLPSRSDWLQGVLHYVYFLIVGAPLALALHAVHFTKLVPIWQVAGIFLGFFWVLALTEDFLVFGVLQQWMEEWTRNSKAAALVLTAIIFGLTHLWFRGFPNWRWAIIAALLGLACGAARIRTGSIRAGVVTHALVVTTWRAFFF